MSFRLGRLHTLVVFIYMTFEFPEVAKRSVDLRNRCSSIPPFGFCEISAGIFRNHLET